ncbi:MAG: archease [Candidatus Woesearchaeota archaeon]
MKQYEFLPHTADVKFRAYGKTMEEAFSNAALALAKIITDDKVEENIEKEISVEAEDEKALLYDFLEQFLILIDSENFLLSKVKELKIDGLKLKAKIVGDTELDKYEINTHIKAITYQEMEINKEKDKYMVQVIPDL